MSQDPFIEMRFKYVMRGVPLYHDITVERGENALLFDVNGNVYIDFTSGIGVTNLGHANPELIEAAIEQLRKLWHISFMVANYKPYVELAKRLSEIAPGKSEKQVILQNSGSEAVENAIKAVRQVTRRPYILAYDNSFHGRGTFGYALASTWKYDPYKVDIDPPIPYVEFIPYPYCYRCPFKQEYPGCGLACLDYVRKWFSLRIPPKKVAGALVEVVQGEGGFVVAPRDYVRELKKFLEDNDIKLIDDEVQAGWGRTGRLWAIEHYDVEPDVIVTAKAIANGLPLSAVIGKKDIFDKTIAGSFGGTFGGNPVAAAVALKVIEIMVRDNIPERAERIGKVMRRRLEEMREKYELIGDVRGLGAMQAIELVKDSHSKEPATKETSRVIEIARRKGLLLLRAGPYLNVIRLHPPLTIEEDLLMKGLNILEESIGEVSREYR